MGGRLIPILLAWIESLGHPSLPVQRIRCIRGFSTLCLGISLGIWWLPLGLPLKLVLAPVTGGLTCHLVQSSSAQLHSPTLELSMEPGDGTFRSPAHCLRHWRASGKYRSSRRPPVTSTASFCLLAPPTGLEVGLNNPIPNRPTQEYGTWEKYTVLKNPATSVSQEAVRLLTCTVHHFYNQHFSHHNKAIYNRGIHTELHH